MCGKGYILAYAPVSEEVFLITLYQVQQTCIINPSHTPPYWIGCAESSCCENNQILVHDSKMTTTTFPIFAIIETEQF